jgi:hypothetical protein
VVGSDISTSRVKTTVPVPRVLNRTINRVGSILEENKIYPNRTEIMEEFNGNKIYQGTVTSYNEETALYRINYVDGEWEEMNRKQV